MTRTLLATKLYAPRLRRGLVARPGLLARVEGGAEARLTLVSAPAGFGKSTILADWLHQRAVADRYVAWLSLDPADDEPAMFWTYVVTALHGAVPDLDGSALFELLDSTPLPVELMLTTLLNELATAPGEVWLILDDYHTVNDHEVSQGMAFLVDHLPAHVHVVLSTRADPDLPLARWRARGELVEIRVADLRFTPEETFAYLAGATGHALAAADVEVLAERTEGWIAALQLAALSLRGRDDVSGFIRRFAGDDRYIVDYLIEEVLRHLPDPVRGFLLRRQSSTGSPARCATPSPVATTAARCSRLSNAPTCSSSPSTTSGSGTATTTCSPTSCGRACSASNRTRSRCCTSAPASGTSATS